MDTQEAYDVLLHAEIFSEPLVGFVGHLAHTVEAFLTLLRAARADELFKTLMEEATLPGQLYALCGLYFTDQEAFSESVDKYRDREEFVDYQVLDMQARIKVSDLVEAKHVPVVRLDAPEQTVKEWRERHKGQDAVLDISGGGYSAYFREFEARI